MGKAVVVAVVFISIKLGSTVDVGVDVNGTVVVLGTNVFILVDVIDVDVVINFGAIVDCVVVVLGICVVVIGTNELVFFVVVISFGVVVR